jgi:hypothetical protein
MKLHKLVTIKPHKYGTRHLTAGEEYEAPPRHAIALVAGRKARFADKIATKATPAVIEPTGAKSPVLRPEPIMSEAQSLDRLRMEATQLGIDIDGRWGLARLQYEIGRAKS